MTEQQSEQFKRIVIDEILKMQFVDYRENFINTFKKTIRENITKTAKYYVGFTFISIKTNALYGKYEWYKYFIIFPFLHNLDVSSYVNVDLDNSNIRIKDICTEVDESFYRFIHSEMLQRENFLIGKISQEYEVCWSLTNDRIITIINKNNQHSKQNMLIHSNFDEWYENGKIYPSDYIVKVENPYTYLVPFPVKPIFFKIVLYNENGTNNATTYRYYLQLTYQS